jgi:hypothetical protein
MNLTLECDAIFDEQIAKCNTKIKESFSLDVKMTEKRRKDMLVKLKDILATTMSEYSREENNSKLMSVIDDLIATAEKLLMDRIRLEEAVEKDIKLLKKHGHKDPAKARLLYRLASDAPPEGKRAPHSPWTEFLTKDLKSMKTILQAGLAVATRDTIAWMVGTSVVRIVAMTLPLSDDDKEKLKKNKDFYYVVKRFYLNMSSSLSTGVRETAFDLLSGTYLYTRNQEGAPAVEDLCLKLLDLIRPVITEFFRWLHEVDGNALYAALVGHTVSNLIRPDSTGSEPQMSSSGTTSSSSSSSSTSSSSASSLTSSDTTLKSEWSF